MTFTPLCPVSLRGEPRVSPVLRPPHKRGDQPTISSLRNLKPYLLCKGVHANVISPLVGEMSDRTEGGV
ncbi:hypothetical protein SAMN05443582_102384 [Phyllobacterium sp. OV277]|nr:hypothetical protein SAMN05443582_102384 [Phyllobacterium sp. OV277]